MNNNVYIRSERSIMTISLARILFIMPLVIYGFYKNGIYLYQNDYVSLINMFRPLYFIFGGAIFGALVNIIYERLIKKNDDSLLTIIFSSFHVEYGIILGAVMSINANIAIFLGVLFVVLFASKFTNNRINTMAFCFILIYIIESTISSFVYANPYESANSFSLSFMDYMIGRGPGGIASTHVILLFVAIIGLELTNSNKTSIAISAIAIFTLAVGIESIITNSNFLDNYFINNYPFIFTFIATDSVTSCYTIRGKVVFGLAIGLLSFGLSLWNAILAPYIAILVVSLFNNLIDRKANILNK